MLRLAWYSAAAFVVFSAAVLSGVLGPGPSGFAPVPAARLWLAPFGFGASILICAAIAWGWARRGWPRWMPAAALLVVTVIELAIKMSFPETAGAHAPLEKLGLTLGFYPSGHTARSLLLCTLAAPLLPRSWQRALLLCVPLAVASVMVLTGGHYPVDVIGGALLAAAVACLALSRVKAA